MALPKEILHPWLDELITSSEGAMRDVLTQLKTRPTFEEQWPDTYQESLAKGKRRVLQLESIRRDKFTLRDILSNRPEVLKWYEQIS